jgi:hypothetical protein
MLKRAIKAILPKPLHPINVARARIVRASRGRILSGPFFGQIYLTSGEDFIEPGMLIGCYEKELHAAIENVLVDPPALFVDVGASQGFYAVGFARRAPQSRHIAFEMFEPRILQMRRTMAANSVSVEIQGRCSPAVLQATLVQAANAFVLVDVEGYEQTLVDPKAVPLLRGASMIVETHDNIEAGISDELISRFETTHQIAVIHQEERTAKDLPFLMRDPWTTKAIGEGRGKVPQKWLVMTPNAARQAAPVS